MRQHVQILAIARIIHAILLLAFGLLGLLFFGGLAALVGWTQSEDAFAVPILGAIGGALFLIFTLYSLPELIAGIGLLRFRAWARVLMIVLSLVGIAEFPIGTGLSVYGLWVLLSQDGTALFRSTS